MGFKIKIINSKYIQFKYVNFLTYVKYYVFLYG